MNYVILIKNKFQNVFGGWFSTAIVAFLFAGFITYILYIGKGVSVAILLLFAAVLLVRNYLFYKKNALERRFPTGLKKSQSKTVQGIIRESSDNVSEVINRTSKIYSSLINGLSKQEADKLKKCKKKINKLDNSNYIHNYGFVIGNHPELMIEKIKKISKIMDSIFIK